jgi:hypothetical protein
LIAVEHFDSHLRRPTPDPARASPVLPFQSPPPRFTAG